MDGIKIFWTTQAKLDLKGIYDFWKTKSLQAAHNVRSDILKSPKTIVFAGNIKLMTLIQNTAG